MSDNVRRIIPSLSMFLFYPFHSFSRFLPIQRGRFGCDLWIFVACSQCPKKVAQRKWCHFLSVLPGRWQWWQELGRDGLGVVSGSGVGNPQLFCFCLAGQEYPELELSLDHWPPFFVRVLIADTVRRTNDCQVKTTGQTAHRQCACRQFRNERGQVRDGPLFKTCLHM